MTEVGEEQKSQTLNNTAWTTTPNFDPNFKTLPLQFIDYFSHNSPSLFKITRLLNTDSNHKSNAQHGIKVLYPKSPKFVTHFQCHLPQVVVQQGGEETWNLRCFCNVQSEHGLMIQCEKCLNWQHASCVNINANTLPSNYCCPICLGKHIRCSCDDNMNYMFPLIQCSKCGYWVHKKCEDIGIGPYFPKDHVCYKCGGILTSPPDVHLPFNLEIENKVVKITQKLLNELHPSIKSSPFAEILNEEFLGHDVSLFMFVERFYNKMRPFFYLTHPHIIFNSLKKRRGEVSFSFFRAVFYVLRNIYDINQEIAVYLFDLLAKADIYHPYELPTNLFSCKMTPISYSDLAKIEIEKNKHLLEIPQVTLPSDVKLINNKLFCMSPLQGEQLIALIEGFIGTVDEFCYDNGVDSKIYSICGTDLVIDTSKYDSQFIHNFRRSLSPNCVVKLFKCDGMTYAGVFAGISDVNGISKRTRREKFTILPNTELLLPIDFAPATIDEPQQYMSWHFEEIDIQTSDINSLNNNNNGSRQEHSPQKQHRPTREERDETAAIRQVERNKKKKKNKEKEENKIKRKPGKPGKPPRNGIKQQNNTNLADYSLFSLIQTENSHVELFEIPNDDDSHINDTVKDEIYHNSFIFDGEIDCSFIDEIGKYEILPFRTMEINDPLKEMISIINTDCFE